MFLFQLLYPSQVSKKNKKTDNHESIERNLAL